MWGDRRQSVEGNTIILALGVVPRRELADQLRGLDVDFHMVGDCARSGKLHDAVEDGFYIASKV